MAEKTDKLARYRGKRDFQKTREPRGQRPRREARRRGEAQRRGGGRRFVIQKHDATSLHYDFRLEFGGVLVSWAVPKGPSTDPRHKRLAIRTEDHPLDYAEFEGVIPAGEYGGGTVLVWDAGQYRNLRGRAGPHSRSMDRSLEDGLIEVFLQGEKLSGGYALKRIGQGKRERWLLIKMDDEAADARRCPVSTQPASVKSGRRLEEIAEAEGAGND